MIKTIPVKMYGRTEILTVDYRKNANPRKAGFDILNLPFPIEDSIGYPEISAYFKNMRITGYKRYCGFVQFIGRTERKGGVLKKEFSIDVSKEFRDSGNPYFSYGYPASLYDAPCKNLQECDWLRWTAYTYLVQMPTRANHNKMEFLTGFSWGYTEDGKGPGKLLRLKLLSPKEWEKHSALLNSGRKNWEKS